MKRKVLLFVLILTINLAAVKGQESTEPQNLSSEILAKKESKLEFGGYGQVDFSKQLLENRATNASLDVSRVILGMGYSFSSKTSFFSEVEYEHVKELYVEQAFINHSFNDFLNLRAGLILIPMGIINEYHEPTTFNGVNRPTVDNIIVPTTWREIGIGLTGRFQGPGIKYQAYLVNGFSGYDGTKGLINGEKFLRDGRQKGAKSIMTSPDLSVKIDYYGVSGLKIGISGYFGKTESALYKNLDLSNVTSVARADSSILGVSMAGLDVRYNRSGLSLRGELILSLMINTTQYNALTGNDVGRSIRGMYAEIAYNVLQKTDSEYSLTPFFRYENYDTHFKVDPGATEQEKYQVNEFVFGIGWKLAEGAVLKADMQLAKSAADATIRKTVNAGIGVWF
ncbi:MAG: hypothetical protein WC868_10680 [Bacteroidales bacterium]